uniref:Cilia- and flagella-associated protein 157 n=1 Tax=Haptolina brevifila TaxID=156173 RepID=A0A7S2JUC1_9EUKA|mmetsp:Transcript_9415/g.19278  ORF Transcript_9415/g.19278 Transcript_9415/m.19278 type:complete len:271 (+) Transcript_9415:1393-2205(+)
MDALKAEGPALLARRTAARAELEEALGAVERFESGQMPALLSLDGPSAEADGDGAALDERILETSKRLELTAQEVDGRLRAFSQFSETVGGVMNTAASRRDTAQRTLELLSIEQRRAGEEMKLTLNAALEAMKEMQSQWDAAVAANAAELKDLKADTSRAAEQRGAKAEAIAGMRDELAARVASLNELSAERRTLAEEEELLRRRYTQLRQRRDAKVTGRTLFGTTDLEEVAEVAGASAVKAAVKAGEGLLRLLNKDPANPSKKLPPADE